MNPASSATPTNTTTADPVSSSRLGQLTFCSSSRTSVTNCPARVSAFMKWQDETWPSGKWQERAGALRAPALLKRQPSWLPRNAEHGGCSAFGHLRENEWQER